MMGGGIFFFVFIFKIRSKFWGHSTSHHFNISSKQLNTRCAGSFSFSLYRHRGCVWVRLHVIHTHTHFAKLCTPLPLLLITFNFKRFC